MSLKMIDGNVIDVNEEKYNEILKDMSDTIAMDKQSKCEIVLKNRIKRCKAERKLTHNLNNSPVRTQHVNPLRDNIRLEQDHDGYHDRL